MKQFSFIKQIAAAIMVAAMAIGAGIADAGTLQTSQTIYAIEGICSNTTIKLDPTGTGIVYTMGVPRMPDQAFEIRYELRPEGALFQAIPNLPVCDVPGVQINHRSGGVGYNFVEYDVAPGNLAQIPQGSTITWIGPTVNNVTLDSVGSQLALVVELRDKISYPNPIDNTPVTGVIATAAYAADFWNSSAGTAGVKTDTGTTIDAKYETPLAGFVVQNDDRTLVAAATVQIKNKTPGVKDPGNPNNDYILKEKDKVVVTIEDPTGFKGMKTDKPKVAIDYLWWDLDDSGTRSSGETFTVNKNKGIATLTTLNGNHSGFGADHNIYYEVDGKTMLNERTLKISGKVNAQCGIGHDFTGNDEWWIWNCHRGVVLQAPLFQVPPGWLSRFVLTNDCDEDATYDVRYLSEKEDQDGNPVAVNIKSSTGQDTGTVLAKSTLVLEATGILNVSGADSATRPRGTAIFTVDAPSACIQGLYQVVNAMGSAVSNHVMVRPGTN